MRRTIVKSKIHRATVTQARLHVPKVVRVDERNRVLERSASEMVVPARRARVDLNRQVGL